MTKIYNEVIIDMNPESSSYGETLHEDSFEYEGQLALAGAVDDRIRATAGYKDHQWSNGRPIMLRHAPGGELEFYIYNKDATVVHEIVPYTSAKESINWERAINRQKDWVARLGREAEEGYKQEVAQVAPDIEYSDISRFIDPSTGDVIDKAGLTAYFKTLPGMPQDQATLEAFISEMPNMSISAQDKASAMAQRTSDIYGLQSGMKQSRAQERAMAGATGVYSPTSSGFGGGDTSDIYGQLGALASTEGDVYGLGADKEEEFANWIQGLVGGE